MAMSINDLSDEILLEIFTYLDIINHTRFQEVCQRWQLLIRSIWSKIEKIVFEVDHSRVGFYPETEECFPDTLVISVGDMPYIKSILEMCRDNLVDLCIDNEAEYYGSTDAFEPLNQCKTLKSFRIFTFNNILIQGCLKFLPMEGLEKLTLTNIEDDFDEELYKILEEKLKQAQTLKSLSISGVSLEILRVVEKMKTLECLDLGKRNESIEEDEYMIDTSDLTNLKKFTIDGE